MNKDFIDLLEASGITLAWNNNGRQPGYYINNHRKARDGTNKFDVFDDWCNDGNKHIHLLKIEHVRYNNTDNDPNNDRHILIIKYSQKVDGQGIGLQYNNFLRDGRPLPTIVAGITRNSLIYCESSRYDLVLQAGLAGILSGFEVAANFEDIRRR